MIEQEEELAVALMNIGYEMYVIAKCEKRIKGEVV